MKRTLAALAVLAMMVAGTAVPASAHDPVGDDRLKGSTYDEHLGDVSDGGVPYEAMSDIRCEDGMAGIFPCHRVDLGAFIPLPDIEATSVNDVWGWEDPATGMQVAIVGTIEGTAFIDVTVSTAPVYLGTLPSAYPDDFGNFWGDVRVHDNHAYIGAEAFSIDVLIAAIEFGQVIGQLEGFGVQVVDLTQFRGATSPIEISETNRITDMTQSHNLSLNTESERLYVAGSVYGVDECVSFPTPIGGIGSGGSLIYDISDPANPVHIGCLDPLAYNHDVQCVTYHGPDTRFTGNEICIGSNEAEMVIYDASDATNPVRLSSVGYLDLPWFDEERGVPNYYTHQGWLSEDHAHFFLGDELDEFFGPADERTTYLWDLDDLTDPQLISAFTDGETSIDHNMFVLDHLLYQANYTAGLSIYDTWKVEQGRMTQRGFFDVFPANDDTEFGGAWGVYPFFGDGKVIMTSTDEGVFVLDSRAKSAATNNGRRGR